MRVLIIDDKIDILDTLTKELSREKGIDGKYYEVATEQSHKKALDVLNHDYFEVVLVDMFASDQTRAGLKILQELAKKSPVTIVITAFPSISNCVECMQSGCWNYLDKTEMGTSYKALFESISTGCKQRLKSTYLGKPDPNVEWVDENISFLEENYPDQHIVVFDCEVIAHAPKLGKAQAQIKDRYFLSQPFFFYVSDPNEEDY